MNAGDRLTLFNTPPEIALFRLLCTPVVPSERPGQDTGLSRDGREFCVPISWLEKLQLMLATDSEFGVMRGQPPFALERFWLWQIVKYDADTWRRFTVPTGIEPDAARRMEDRVVRPLRHALRTIGLDLGLVLDRELKAALLSACRRS